ncbi:ORC-CDC6 family AAA ATPase [Cupriavidus plantarum]|uniref:Uncharacterized protein n=1 Tax=Cupriavidus plantarum TaxID=942865 RepID=A0A316EID9_9BURK|nr:hypothetical protein [Cupriavidus plantarum]PWK31910.1 hypothetical protein C7419_10850 [Cupriavidus plantarum]
MQQINPFAFYKASDYTDEQINHLWVELGSSAMDEIIEPRSPVSKIILGGKGTGKTHLLRYYSFPVARLRYPRQNGIEIAKKLKFLGVFLRANSFDAARFEPQDLQNDARWKLAFSLYLEFRLAEAVLENLEIIRASSANETFDDQAFLEVARSFITDPVVAGLTDVADFRVWVTDRRRDIDQKINNFAFSGELELTVPFAVGALSLGLSRCIAKWHPALDNPLIFLIDEVENFSELQQQVLNTMIRFGEGRTTFRIGGRIYAIKTFATLANGEINREGSEYKKIILDETLRTYTKYPEFARKFVVKRLVASGVLPSDVSPDTTVDPRKFFCEIDSSNFYERFIAALIPEDTEPYFLRSFQSALESLVEKGSKQKIDPVQVVRLLTAGLPLLLQKLNVLLFCKKAKSAVSCETLAQEIHADSLTYRNHPQQAPKYYITAYGHYSGDLLAQICRESRRSKGVPYAGFDTFVQMSSGNPRNLLVILGRAYSIAMFKDIDFINEEPLDIDSQNQAVREAARFMLESDSNIGSQSDIAAESVTKLASLLRTARYALNIPEVSPLVVSFADEDLSDAARSTLIWALNLSFIFEIGEGRPDRNSHRLLRKIQLNPVLAPRWDLPIGRRGDIRLSAALLEAIFESGRHEEFDVLLKGLDFRWNNPFAKNSAGGGQTELF